MFSKLVFSYGHLKRSRGKLSSAKDTTSNPNHGASTFNRELVIARHTHRERRQLTVVGCWLSVVVENGF